jgi:hypothetical protein
VSDRIRVSVLSDEALAPGQLFTIQLSMLERFVDERPATLLRNETKRSQRKLFVRDETNGVIRAFTKPFPHDASEFTETHLVRGKRAVLVHEVAEDRVVMHEPARIASCSLCEERDVFGAPAVDGALCARCITAADCSRGGVDADFARALLRHELATHERASMRAMLSRLDGFAPWTFFPEKFAQAAWGFDDALRARAVLVDHAWRGALEVGNAVDVFALNAGDAHPWLDDRKRMRFTVNATTITARDGDVVATRS